MHLKRQIPGISRALAERFGDRVTAREDRGLLVLEGELDSWDDVVAAGVLAADHRSRYYTVNNIACPTARPFAAAVPPRDSALEGLTPDVLVIGGGVVGCAIARELSKWKLDVLLVEKECDVSLHASGRNDGMVHPGLDLRRGSLKHRYNHQGNAMYGKVCAELGVPFQRTGQLLCFQKPFSKALLWCTLPYWKYLGVEGHPLNTQELHALEPAAAPDQHGAMFFPGAGVVCPYNLTIAYAENAVQNGVTLSLDTQVTGMTVKGGYIEAVETNRGTLRPRLVVNAAGVFSEEIAKMAGDHFFSIHPRKGTNSILDKKAKGLVNTILSTLGTTATKSTHSKGGGIVSTADGNVLVGPDAHETYEREDFATASESVRATFEKQRHAAEGLREGDIITYFTGIRAATYEEDFIVRPGMFTENLLHAAGIQSPGLTAAPAIALEIERLAVEYLSLDKDVARNESFDPHRAPIPRVAELSDRDRAALIAQNPDYGEIICRCEEISKGEILDALRRNVPCATMDGVKRRVRPGMGRCQGGFCGPLVTGIIAGEKGTSLTAVRKSGRGSEVLLCETKGGEDVG